LFRVQPSFVSPFVLAVAHPDGPEASGKVFEVGAGFVAEIRWERSKGSVFKTDASFTPSAVSSHRQMRAVTWCLTDVMPRSKRSGQK
jgi:hypothetical protein